MHRKLLFILSLFCLFAITLALPACSTSRGGGGDDDDAASNDDDVASNDDDAVSDDDDDDDDDDDATDDDDAVEIGTPCADDDWSEFDCNPLTQAPCDLGTGEACDVAFDPNVGLTGFACYPAPNDAQVGETCDGGNGPWCAGGATCVEASPGAGTFVCATWCCDDAQCGAGETCQITETYSPIASDLGVCL
jgi:hypothetical protein